MLKFKQLKMYELFKTQMKKYAEQHDFSPEY